jgi:hypothetical protein
MTYLRTSGSIPFNVTVTASRPEAMLTLSTPSMSANFCFSSSVSVFDLAPPYQIKTDFMKCTDILAAGQRK